jgi:hypothetical protein
MLSLRSLRSGAIVAAAFTFAACGSDDLTSPDTNNDALLAEVTAALGQTSESEQPVRFQALGAAAAALTAGAPVTSGTVIIDDDTLAFDLTSVTISYDDGYGPYDQQTYVVGWRPGNIDSLAVFTYIKGYVAGMRHGPVFGGAMLAGRGGNALRSVAPMVENGGGTVSKMPYPIDLQSVAFSDGQAEWASNSWSVSTGSIVYGAASGECDDIDPSDFGMEEDLLSCAQQGVSVDGVGQLYELPEQEETGPVVRLPGQVVGGVVGVFQGAR